MVSTPSSRLGFELQGQNDNVGSWWDNLNDGCLQLMDDATAREVIVSTTGGDTALSVVSYDTDEARCPIIRIAPTQTLVSAVRVTTARARIYFVTNESAAGAFTVKFGGNTSLNVTIPRGSGAYVRVRTDSTTTFAGPLMVLATGAVDPTSLVGGFLLNTNNLSDVSTPATARSNLGLAIGANVQAFSANLSSYAAQTPTALLATLLESGTVMPFFQASAPTGWTKQTSHDNKTIRVTSGSGGGSGGSVAFTTVFARTATDGYSLQVGDLAPHGHGVTGGTLGGTSTNGGLGGVGPTPNGAQTITISNTGSGTAHAHNIDLRVQYVDMILCSRN